MHNPSPGVNLRAPYSKRQNSRPDKNGSNKSKATKDLEIEPHSIPKGPRPEKVIINDQNSKNLDKTHLESENPDHADVN